MKPIVIKHAKDFIVETIKDQIMSGELTSDDELTQEMISKQTGLSRIPTREALIILEQEGFLKKLPNQRVKVISPSKQNIIDYFKILSALESEMLSIIVMLSGGKKQLRQKIKSFGAIKNCDCDIEFHKFVTKFLDNGYIENFASKMFNSYFGYAIENFWMKSVSDAFFTSLKKDLAKDGGYNFKDITDKYYLEYANLLIGAIIQ